MANRTVKFMGYTTDNATVVFSFNGTEVFNGAVSPMGDTNTPVALFEFDIDQTLSGDIASSISVSGGDVTVVALSANFNTAPHAELTSKNDGVVIPALTEEDASSNYEWIHRGSKDMNSGITINGVEFIKDSDDATRIGAWHIDLSDSDVMACDWAIDATTTL